ncbi:MAG: phosphate/phosphite/phosphonate ABC transporter substrate-binding protein [Rhodoplanes sp.]
MSPLDDAGGTGRSAIGEMVFACDANLGFPCDHPEWAAFFSDHGWRTVDYDDMGRLTETLKSHAATAAFLPAANYFYLRDDPYYAGFASALAMKTSGTTVSSVLIVPKASEARSIVDLKGKRLGYINLYCTTSYFSPAILLAEHNIPFEGFFSTVRPLAAWQHQIDAVVAGDVDASMVEEGIWHDNPANAQATRIIGRVDRLPGPVIVLARTADADFASAFLAKLLATRTARPNQPFAGYAPYCRDVVQAFFERSERAFSVVTA